ncbi:MAG: stage II sporulation protein P [Clostridia bacterium]|nr:stage II sporulation protein P [Clostridia bacterium]
MKQDQTGPRSLAPAAAAAVLLLLAAVLCISMTGIPLAVAALMFERSLPDVRDAPPQTTAVMTETVPAKTTTAALPVSLTETPADLLALVEKYSALLGDGSGGRIKTVNYGKKGATDLIGSVMIKNTTQTKRPDFAALLREPLQLQIDPEKPAVLIFHSHTSESYMIVDRDRYDPGFTAHSNDPAINVVRVGDEIAHTLERSGYTVIHDTVIHDTDYTGSYPHSRKTLEQYLAQYPNLQILLDIHRDSIDLEDGTKMRPVATVGGKRAAQLMIISGAQEGKVTAFPHWEANLRFALQLQKRLADNYPGLMRPLLFSQRKYNMDLTRCSLLIEVGSEGNTLEEACYSGRLLAAALAEIMEESKG